MQLQWHIPSDLKAMACILETLEQAAYRWTNDAALVNRLVLAASEAITNAMRHGNRMDPTKQVHIVLDALDPHVLELCVEDEGEGFDRSRVPSYNPEDKEMLLQPGGRGLFLMEKLADQVIYEASGRRVRMRFRRTG
ncbi:Serine-protein kinase RsbW [bacterium HR18]|jgi:serine/threonine-protein kinase RsbW|uniref:ATP-binding protein n=1 Tax=Rhodothermus marinus TaxID=29549 RepID=A0A7V2F7B0_RHOMR|nr:Serine-protein kinase RsbW [bacterium HR18]